MSTNSVAQSRVTPQRTVLTADTTYYVRTDGSDSNNGLANTAGGAFLTIQKAINVIYGLDMAGFTATIQVGAGTYSAGVSCTKPFIGGTVQLTGDTTTPANVVISVSSGSCIAASLGAIIQVAGFKLINSGGNGISAVSHAVVTVNGNMNYGACTGQQIVASSLGRINVTAAYTVSGNAGIHAYATQQGNISVSFSGTVTFSGTPAWSTAGLAADTFSYLLYNSAIVISGSATGKRYAAGIFGYITTFGGGANYFPGNVAGTADTSTANASYD